MEVRRQIQDLVLYAGVLRRFFEMQPPSPSIRHLAPLTFISLPDGTAARLIFGGSTVFDQSQNATLYRRDLTYSVEYATTITALQPSMLFGSLDLNAANFIE